MFHNALLTRLTLSAAALAFVPGTAPAQDSAAAVLKRASAAMGEKIAFSRGEPQGGGGYPLSGQQRNDQFVSGAYAWNALPAGAKPPTTPNANNVNLIENIERLKLSIDRILPLHGRVVPLAELYTTAGRTAP